MSPSNTVRTQVRQSQLDKLCTEAQPHNEHVPPGSVPPIDSTTTQVCTDALAW